MPSENSHEQPLPNVVRCELCGAPCATSASFVVRVDVFADPSLPDMSGAALAAMDIEKVMAEISAQAANYTAEELQDGVHRRFEYRLCPRCHPEFLANPLGMPRKPRTHAN